MTRPSRRLLIPCVAGILLLAAAGRAATWQIQPDGSGDAPTIAAALAAAIPGDQIVLAAGTYFEHDLELVDGVDLRGATGVASDVVLDAAHLGRVLRAIQVGEGTSIDGLTLTGGLVAGTCPGDPGTGTYCMGGAALLLESAPEFLNCTFAGNEAEDNGGAVASVLSAPSFRRCTFRDNRARHGGAITFVSSALGALSPRVERCVFEANRSGADGGAIYVYISDPAISGCTFRANEAIEQGSAIFWHEPSPPVVDHCIFAFGLGGPAMFSGVAGAAPSLVCCDVFGNAGGDWTGCLAGQDLAPGNLSADPLFCAADGASLLGDSPCVASGCGLIGADDAPCAPTSAGAGAEFRTWGVVKAAYRSSARR